MDFSQLGFFPTWLFPTFFWQDDTCTCGCLSKPFPLLEFEVSPYCAVQSPTSWVQVVRIYQKVWMILYFVFVYFTIVYLQLIIKYKYCMVGKCPGWEVSSWESFSWEMSGWEITGWEKSGHQYINVQFLADFIPEDRSSCPGRGGPGPVQRRAGRRGRTRAVYPTGPGI